MAKSGHNIHGLSSIHRQLFALSDQGIHRENDGQMLLVQDADLRAERLRWEGGELERVHDDDLTVDREGWIQVAVRRPEFAVENERDHNAVRGGLVAVALDDWNERNEGPGAALVQMDVELTH
jgi:hypothetical protein